VESVNCGGREHPFSAGASSRVSLLLTHTADVPNPAPLKWFFIKGEEFDRAAQMEARFVHNPTLAAPPGRRWARNQRVGHLVRGARHLLRVPEIAPSGVQPIDAEARRRPDPR
jgi:hypothetical protein